MAKTKDPPATRAGVQDTTPPASANDGVWSTVRAASSLDKLSKLKALVYGPSGAGKTFLASRFRQPLIALTEHQAVPTVQEANPAALVHLIDGPGGIARFRKLIHSPDLAERVDAVVLDSLTDAQRLIRRYYTDNQKSGRPTTDMETWGIINDATSRLAREVRDLPVHVVVICVEREESVDGVLIHRPGVQGRQLPNDLSQFFNVVGYVYRREHERGIRHEVMFSGGDRYLVKGMAALDAIEPPEPLLWVHKRFGEDLPDDVRERVEAWRALAGSDKPGDGDTTSAWKETMTTDNEERPADPFARA